MKTQSPAKSLFLRLADQARAQHVILFNKGSKFTRVGYFYNSLSEEDKELLKQLKSDELRDVRPI